MINKTWTPTKRQEDFISLPDSIFEALYGGAAGGGKTETLLLLPLLKRSTTNQPLYEYSRFKALYLRRTFPELDNEVIPRSREFYPSFGFKPYNSTQKRWTHPSGAIIQFGHCEHSEDVHNYDTAEYNLILWDEVTSFLPSQYEYISFTRCRTSDPELPKLIRSGTNPGNIGHSYFRRRFVSPARDGNVILRERRKIDGVDTELTRIYIPSKATDNDYLIKADPGYIARLDKLPPAEKAAKLYGDWWVFSGQVFDDFRTEPLNGEPVNANHVCDPFQIPYYWPRILAIDWGYAALTVAHWYAINPIPSEKYPAKIYVYREYSERKKLISTWAADIARLSQGETYMDIVMDPSAWSKRGDEFTIVEQFVQASGLSPRKADNDRLGGKLLIQEYLRFNPKPPRFVPPNGFDQEEYWKIHRLRGLAAAQEYYQVFQPETVEQFIPKIKFFSTCMGVIDNIPKCVYVVNNDRKSEENPEGIAEEVAELKNDVDDFYDELRYGLKACQFYLDSGSSEHRRVEQMAKIVENYQRTGNATQFYMNLADAENIKEIKRVKRFRGSRLKYANF